MKISEDRLDLACKYAAQKFWEAAAESYPEVKSGDLDPCTVMVFDANCRLAVASWLRMNLDNDAEV